MLGYSVAREPSMTASTKFRFLLFCDVHVPICSLLFPNINLIYALHYCGVCVSVCMHTLVYPCACVCMYLCACMCDSCIHISVNELTLH